MANEAKNDMFSQNGPLPPLLQNTSFFGSLFAPIFPSYSNSDSPAHFVMMHAADPLSSPPHALVLSGTDGLLTITLHPAGISR
jgi:hypothetical protein